MGDLPYQGNACLSVKNGQLFSVELIGYRQREEGFDSSGNTVVEELQKEKIAERVGKRQTQTD